MNEFNIHKKCFPGVNGEALFVGTSTMIIWNPKSVPIILFFVKIFIFYLGTILHSLDHTMMDNNLEDPLWLDSQDSKFTLMAQLGQIVKVGFVKDVPGIYFHKRFKGSGHPFYEAVYEKAAKINQELADKMDTCIIK